MRRTVVWSCIVTLIVHRYCVLLGRTLTMSPPGAAFRRFSKGVSYRLCVVGRRCSRAPSVLARHPPPPSCTNLCRVAVSMWHLV